LQRLALHLDEGLFPRRMHGFQDKLAPVGRDQMEIIVVFAGKRPGCSVEAEDFVRQAGGFRFGCRLSDARFGNHAGNLIRKGQSASILADLRREAMYWRVHVACEFFSGARSGRQKNQRYISLCED
jgi:hypothetical protein